MNCEEFVRQSDEWIEGRRSAQAREHAMACERCRGFVEDLDAIRLAAPQMAASATPPASLWQSIHAQMEKEGLIRHIMTCEEFAHQSDEWMDGRRSAQAREHAMACEHCRSLVEDLDAIRLAAPQMAASAAPPASLWQSIHAQMEKEGLIRHIMTCEEFAHQSDEWMEGRRSAQAREHAMACEHCRSFVEDLDAIRLAAPQMAASAAPPASLWQSIHAQMEKEGLIHRPVWPVRAIRWAFVSHSPVAAVAAGLALALLTFTMTAPRLRTPVSTGHAWLSADEAELASVDTQLDHVELGEMHSTRVHTPNPVVVETLQQNLVIVDHQIARCEKTLEEAPSDQNTRDYLYDAYQQKANLLNMMAEGGISPTQ